MIDNICVSRESQIWKFPSSHVIFVMNVPASLSLGQIHLQDTVTFNQKADDAAFALFKPHTGQTAAVAQKDSVFKKVCGSKLAKKKSPLYKKYFLSPISDLNNELVMACQAPMGIGYHL